MPGARCTRSLARNKKAHEGSHHRHAETTGHSLRVGFNGYFVLSPVTGSIECTHLLLRRPAKTDSLLGLALEGAMREEIGLGRFGDRRLEKGGCRCMRRLYEGPVRVFDALLETERGKFSSRAFCA